MMTTKQFELFNSSEKASSAIESRKSNFINDFGGILAKKLQNNYNDQFRKKTREDGFSRRRAISPLIPESIEIEMPEFKVLQH